MAKFPETLIDNASLLNACYALSGSSPLTAVGVCDLGTVVQALLLSERIVTLSGSTNAAAMRSGSAAYWNLASPKNLYRALLSQDILSFHVLDASWHHDHLQGREQIDRVAALLDIDAIPDSVTREAVDNWRELAFGCGATGEDSGVIYAAPPAGKELASVQLRERRLDPVSLFISQTILYCWHAYERDLPLMLSALRRPVAVAALSGLELSTRSALSVALERVESAEERFRAEILELTGKHIAEFALPAPLAFVLGDAAVPSDIFRIAIDARADIRFVRFRDWVAAMQEALDGWDVGKFKRLASLPNPVGRSKGPSAGEAVVSLVVEPKSLLRKGAAGLMDRAIGKIRLRVTLISDIESGDLRRGGGLSKLESLVGRSMPAHELSRLESLSARRVVG